MSIPSFRKNNITIPFSSENDKNTGITNILHKENDNVLLKFPQTKENYKTNGNIYLNLLFGKDKSNNRLIVDRILNGEYKLCDSTIQIKDNDLYLLLTYNQPDTPKTKIDPNIIMGVDLGITRPVSIYIHGIDHQPKQIEIGHKIQHERLKHYYHRCSLQETLKYSTGGHGRNKKLQALNILREKEKNWSKNINHKISHDVIKICIEHNVGVIKLEDLTGISMNTNNYFLKSWAYYQLQAYIIYKAKQVGIKILWVDPKNTSITCPTCNIANPINRDKIDKTIFKCQNIECNDFNIKKDCDILAAYNITHKIGYDVKGNSKEGRILKSKEKKKLTPQQTT